MENNESLEPQQPTALSAEEKEARLFAMLCHLSALAGVTSIPFANIIGPLIFWLIKKDQHPLVDDQGKESLNFQITVSIGILIGVILMLVVIGIFVIIAVAIAALVFIILASIAANNGERYRYPYCIRLIK